MATTRTYGTGTKVTFAAMTGTKKGFNAAVSVTDAADIIVLWGDVYTSAAVSEVEYVAPVAADPEADPPVEEVLEVEYVAPQPDETSFRLPPGKIINIPYATTLNLYSPNGDADVRVLLYADATV